MKKRNLAGVTLIELVITMFVGGILFLTIGMIIIYSQVSWRKAMITSDADRSFGYAKKKLIYLMRTATTPPAIYSYDPAFSDPFIIDPSAGGERLEFQTLANNGGVKTYALGRISRDAATKNMIYEYWYANTGGGTPPQLTYNTGAAPAVREVLMGNAEQLNFNFAGAAGNQTSAVRAAIKRKIVMSLPSTNSEEVLVDSITVRARGVPLKNP
jgi:hypothetical protein